MEYRRLGHAGLKVSALSLGSWLTFGKQISDGTAADLMKLAYDHGVNFFDNAEIYARGQSEIVMGKILKQMEWPRDTWLVSSKVYFGAGGKLPNQTGLSRKHILEACDAALKRLQVDYLDLYFCHRPDYQTPVEETVFAMNTLIQQGKILYWGTSEWPAERIMEAHLVARENRLIPPQMEQPQYNLFHRKQVELDYQPLYERGMGTTIWSPLASGLLTGKYNDAGPDDTRFDIPGMEWLKAEVFREGRMAQVRALTALAAGLGISMTHLALAWCAKNPNVSTIILGASRTAQLSENLKALGALPLLTPDVMEQIEQIVQNKPQRTLF